MQGPFLTGTVGAGAIDGDTVQWSHAPGVDVFSVGLPIPGLSATGGAGGGEYTTTTYVRGSFNLGQAWQRFWVGSITPVC